MEVVEIKKLVHGGQGMGELADGRKVFAWNSLPGERVCVRLIKQKSSYAEAIAEKIMTASPDRVEPIELNYLATSPWQIMTFEAENRAKVDIVEELFAHSGLDVVSGKAAGDGEFISPPRALENPPGVFHYRNKMEYSFWGDDDGLHLALHQRGRHGKHVVHGSVLAMSDVDAAANAVLDELKRLRVRASDLKTVIVRCDQKGNAAASLFVKPSKFPRLKLQSQVKNHSSQGSPLNGLRVYHSNPKSPASVRTRLLYEEGNCRLSDTLLGKEFHYDVDSFFQINLPVYQQVLENIRSICQGDPVDMYAGVGSIGLTVAKEHVMLVELDPATAAMARLNSVQSDIRSDVIESSTEKALEYIVAERPVIFDPPRAGLHKKVIERCLEVRPPQIIYLSCNPATQARDLTLLQQAYCCEGIQVYNFFPRTPHIETLAVLSLKS